MSRNLLCELCWSPMPSPRMRNGLVTCVTCDPSDPPRPHRLPRYRPGRSKLGPRSSSTPTKHLTREFLASQAALLEPEDFAALADRPRTRGDCEPCKICEEYLNEKRNHSIAGICGVGNHDSALYESEEQGVSRLRGSGDNGVRCVEEVWRILEGHGASTVERALDRPHRQRRKLRASELPMGDEERTEPQPVLHQAIDRRRTDSADGGLGARTRSRRGDNLETAQQGVVRLSCGHDPELAERRCRPCPYVGCRYHLALDVNPETGSIKLNHPDLEPDELQHSCSLDIAATGAQTLEEVGLRLNLTRERVRQLEVIALHKLKLAGAEL